MPPIRRTAALAAAILAACGTVCLFPAAAHAVVSGSPHDFSATQPSGYNHSSANLAPSGACSACHIPHGAQDYALWTRSLAGYRNNLTERDDSPSSEPNFLHPPTLSCYDCHDFHGAGGINNEPSDTYFDGDHQPHDILFGFTKNSPGSMTEYNAGPQAGKTIPGFYETNPVGSASSHGVDTSAPLEETGGHFFKYSDPDSGGSAYQIGDKLPCRDCHDPHAWHSNWQAFIKPNIGGSTGWSRISAGQPTASTYMANDVPTGASGRDDIKSRQLCVACHGDTSLTPVNLGDINPAYTNNVAIKRPPSNVAEHSGTSQVACVSCHKHNSVGASCSQCHGYPPSDTATVLYPAGFTPSPDPDTDADPDTRGSHPRHTGAKAGAAPNSFSVYSFPCETCHYASTGLGSGMGYHTNDNVSIVVKGVYTKAGGEYDTTNYYNQAYGIPPAVTGQLDNTQTGTGWGYTSPSRYGWNSCQFVYCHSAGRVKSSMADNEYRRPQFNTGPLGCNGCHGDPAVGGSDPAYGMPGYPSGGPGTDNANSHAAHVVSGGYECSVCHAGTATGSGAARAIVTTTPTLHVNTLREVQLSGVGPSASYDNATKRCSDVSCHGSATPQWGGTLANGCFDCHAGTEQIYKPQNDYGTAGAPNPVDNNEYLYSGHGRSGSNYAGSNNLPAGFSDYTSAPVDCYVCHSQTASHTTKSTNDPFRLGSSTDGTTGGMGNFTGAWADNTDLLCLGCHGTAAQRSGHDNAAQGTTTVNAQTHAQGITGTKYTWPVTPWTCVDCHDPHGDGGSGTDRYMMIRSGINAPIDNTDSSAGSDAKSRPKRTDANVRAVSFNSLAGYSTTAGVYSYANEGNSAPWGPCEVCHTQTTAYSRTLDNTSSHGTRTSRCTTCHPHDAGFAATACKGCHGPDGVAPTAPDISAYWSTTGHGKASVTSNFGRAVECEDCHDASYLTSGDHKTDDSVPGSPPLNINTQTWPGKPALNGDTTPNVNTAHLLSGFIDNSGTSRYTIAKTFDAFCVSAPGCHDYDYHRHQQDNGPTPRDVMRFGDKNTVPNPKEYNWYSLSSYPIDFYRSQSPWTDNDIRLEGGLPDAGNSYGLCVTCHDPHGTATTDTSSYPGLGTSNHMVRGNWKTDSGSFCNTACHTKRSPP